MTTLELLLDLVFVYAITQVTSYLAHHLTGTGLVQGLVLMGLIWFGWAAYAWLGNQARADEGPLRLAIIFAMIGFFVVALTVPEAFHDRPGGLPGPVVFVLAYATVRLAHLAVYRAAAAGDADLITTLRRAFLAVLPSLLLLGTGAAVPDGWRLPLWTLAVLLDYGTVFATGGSGWRVRAPGHFAERHGLIVLIAIGESIVSVGVGVAGAAISWPILGGSTLGIIIAVALWWTYFDVVALVAEHTLSQLTGDARTRLARDSYTFLHLPVVFGIVLLAVGTKVVLLQSASPEASHSAPLPGLALWVLYGGLALYLISLSVLRWRNVGRPNVQRLVAGGLLLVAAATATAGSLPALVHLSLVTGALVVLLTYEVIRFADVRERVRHRVV